MQRQPSSALLVAVFCTLGFLATEAQAYLDPSTGSMILSAVVGLVATIGLAVKTYWYKLKNLLNRRPAAASDSKDAAKLASDTGQPAPSPRQDGSRS